MRKPGNIFLLAIVIGALSAAMVYRYLHDLKLQMEATSAAAHRGGVVDVVVASDTIGIGSRITASNLRTAPWPVEAQPEGAFHDPKMLVDGIARATIGKNAPILQSQIVGPGSGLLPVLIDEGKRGMSVKVDEVTGVSGFITPNSRVDVLVAGTDGSEREQRSKLVLQNVKVLATGTSIEQHDEKPVEVPTVTLLVSPEEAETLTLAARYEPVRLALRNYRDDGLVPTRGVSATGLFQGPPPPPEMPHVAVKDGRRPRHSVQVLLGEKMTTQDIL